MEKISSFCLTFLVIITVLSCSDPVAMETDAVNIPTQQPEEPGAEEAYMHGGTELEFDDAEIFFEWNTTDNDLGLQIFLDAEGWERVRVMGPMNKKIVEVMAAGNLKELGITELFFESAEPSPEEVLALFPAGEYKFQGRTVEGDRLVADGELSQEFLPAPTFSPSDDEEVDPANVVVTWNAPGAEFVEVILENEETDEVFDVIVEGSKTSLTIPPQFLDYDTEYKIEILSIAENGNKIIAESFFVTKAMPI